MSTITLYEQMSDLSGRMVTAAQAAEWDSLVALEAEVAALRERLATSNAPLPASPAERLRKLTLIHRILDDDAEVRRHTEPWMEQVRLLLGAGVRGRGMRDAYGAMSRL